jgi:glycosyltransferase involved in cell wall biosynthesis
LTNAINYFLAQTYPNKELVIISSKQDPAYAEITAPYEKSNVRYYGLPSGEGLSLGELRNISLEKAAGEYFCVWDDDDWYHCRRLEIEMQELIRSGKKGVVLAYCIIYDKVSGEASLSKPTTILPSMLCQKSVISADLLYPARDRNEDTVFAFRLFRKNLIFPMIHPVLYIYVHHGSNTWGPEHFMNHCAHKLSEKATEIISAAVNGEISCEKGSEMLSHPDILSELDYMATFEWADV